MEEKGSNKINLDSAILKRAAVYLNDIDEEDPENFTSGFDTRRNRIASASHHLVLAMDILKTMRDKEAAHTVSHVIHKLAEEVSKDV